MKIYNPQQKDIVKCSYEITLACNLRCSYCYNLDNLDNKKLYSPAIDDIINKVNEANVDTFEFVGGEPLLVHDQVEYFIKNTNCRRYVVFTNLLFRKNKIEKIKNINCDFICSWHDNDELFKENVVYLNKFKNVQVSIILDDINVAYNRVMFLKEHGIDYRIEILRENSVPIFHDFTNPKYNEIMQNDDTIVIFDDVEYNAVEIKKMNFLNISKQYKTICQLSTFSIQFDGTIIPECGYNGTVESLIPQMRLCKGFSCVCNIRNYKKCV